MYMRGSLKAEGLGDGLTHSEEAIANPSSGDGTLAQPM